MSACVTYRGKRSDGGPSGSKRCDWLLAFVHRLITLTQEQELFVAYQSWCAQYHAATELLHTIVPDLDVRHHTCDFSSASLTNLLQPYDHLISSKSELSAFLVKPASRIFKYPLILHVSCHMPSIHSGHF
jgi:hypothetical protein